MTDILNCNRCSFRGPEKFFISKFGKICKTCEKCRTLTRKRDKERYHNNDARKQWQKEYLKKDEVKSRRKKSQKVYYNNNKQKILERNKKYHKANSDKRKVYLSSWRKDNKDKIKEYAHRRRVGESGGDLTSKQIKELFVEHPYCEYCNSIEDLCLDHIIPISKGGENTLSNVTVACKLCNSSKSNKLLHEWRQ